jgi:hypothetical protein
MIISLAWLAEAASSIPSIEGIFLQYGLIGAIALTLGIYARSTIKSAVEAAQRRRHD